jgi:signal transduction histidine kinase
MEPLRVAYLCAFTAAAVACFAGLYRLQRLTDPDTRRGLAGLLTLTGVWSATHVGRLLPFAPDVQAWFYLVGLVVGLGTVGAWLYFCSAYTGRSYHRQPSIRRGALALYLGIVGLKLTNPLHHWYFTVSTTTVPFPHAVVDLGTVHWVVTALSYALSAIGFYLLYEVLSESKLNVTALGTLVGVTALPVVFYVLSFGTTGLLTLHYEPLGVAVFAVGTLYVVDDDFVAVPPFWRTQVIDAIDEVIVLLDDESRIRDVNRRATERFPALADAVGVRLSAVAPDLADAVATDEEIVEIDAEDGDSRRYYSLNTSPLVSGTAEVGRALICTDVTRVERQRRKLKRQNEQFDDLAAAITHEFRNTLTVAGGYFRTVADRHPRDESSTRTACRRVERAHERMGRIVTDLSTLAQHGRAVERVDDCDLRRAVESAVDAVEPDEVPVTVDGNATIMADRSRLGRLFAKAVEFADLYGDGAMAVRAERGRITITVEGEPLPEGSTDRVFEYAAPVPSAETGTLFPTMRIIAQAHGWTVDLDATYRDGVRIVFGAVETGAHAAGSDDGVPS